MPRIDSTACPEPGKPAPKAAPRRYRPGTWASASPRRTTLRRASSSSRTTETLAGTPSTATGEQVAVTTTSVSTRPKGSPACAGNGACGACMAEDCVAGSCGVTDCARVPDTNISAMEPASSCGSRDGLETTTLNYCAIACL